MTDTPEQLVNLGLPVLFVALPVAFYLVIPIVVLETWRARKIAGLHSDRAFAGVALANIISALVGWPLLWAIFAALQGSIGPGDGNGGGILGWIRAIACDAVRTAWLALHNDNSYWMVPIAALILIVPAFIITVLIEGVVLKFCWRKVSLGDRIRFVFAANLYSSGLALILIGLLFLTASIALSVALVVAVFCISMDFQPQTAGK